MQLAPLFIRADATPEMGSGHVMRCLALAQAWREKGGEVIFISLCQSQKLTDKIKSLGLTLINLEETGAITPSNYSQKTLEILSPHLVRGKKQDLWVVMDGYHFTEKFHKTIMDTGVCLLILDDYNHLNRYTADIILNQNIKACEDHYVCPRDTTLVTGSEYTLIRNEFTRYPFHKKNIPDMARNILITMGGADPGNTTLKILKAAEKTDCPGAVFKVIIGPNNPHGQELKHALRTLRADIRLIENADMPRLMSWADIAVTAGGSTCWELCFMGVPFLVVELAQNQARVSASLARAGAAILLGKKEGLTPDMISRSLSALARDKKKRKVLAFSARKLVDGKGARRVAGKMLAINLSLRPAGANDAKLLFGWANERLTRRFSFDSSPIPWDTHIKWFSKKLKDENTFMFIAENKFSIPIGQIRFEKKKECMIISYSLDKGFRGMGIGKNLLNLGLKAIQDIISRPVLIQGKIKPFNLASKACFEGCGFLPVKRNSDHINTLVFQLNLYPKS